VKEFTNTEQFLDRLPTGYEYALEFRHPSWEKEGPSSTLKHYNIATVMNGFSSTRQIAIFVKCYCYSVAVFSLSLMGRNWSDYIAEAKRCLSTNGYLLIAETTKSVKGRMSTIRDIIKKQGFEIYSDEEKEDFTFIEAREL
jgi:hypothetical protein